MGAVLPLLLLAPIAARSANVLVCYHSITNYTHQLAAAVAEGALQPGVHVRLQSIARTDVESDVLQWADAIVIGSPVHYGNPSAAMLAWFERSWEPFWKDPRFEGKLGAMFATGGGLAQGIEHVVASLLRLLASFRIQTITPAPTRSGYDSYGAIAVTATWPFNASNLAIPFVQAGQALGSLVAAAALQAQPSDSRYSASSRGPF